MARRTKKRQESNDEEKIQEQEKSLIKIYKYNREQPIILDSDDKLIISKLEKLITESRPVTLAFRNKSIILRPLDIEHIIVTNLEEEDYVTD